MNNLSWINVFNTSHRRYGFITYAQEAAKVAGYEYFCWNDRVYMSQDGSYTGYILDVKTCQFIPAAAMFIVIDKLINEHAPA